LKLINQQLIKDTNLKLLYSCIYQNRGISRAALAKQTNLSKTTVSTLVDELIARGFILDSGTTLSPSTVGRKPNSLEIRSEKYYVPVLRWEENYIDAHLTDICGITMPAVRKEVGASDSYVTLSRQCIDELIPDRISREQVLGICIVVPAMINMEKEEIYTTTLQFSPNDQNIVSDLRTAFSDYAVAVFNDTACFAYAEKIFANVSEQDFAFINFDRGIGATLFIHNEMLGSASASYTQFGHSSVDPNGKTCLCGNRGCLELMIGEDSLKDRLNLPGANPNFRKRDHITYAELGRAALYGDDISKRVICDIATQFSHALSNLICTVHPKLVVIGGKGHDLGTLFLEEIKKNIKKTGFRQMADSVDIRFSLLDSGACFNGAMKYFFDIHYRFTQDTTGTFYLG